MSDMSVHGGSPVHGPYGSPQGGGDIDNLSPQNTAIAKGILALCYQIEDAFKNNPSSSSGNISLFQSLQSKLITLTSNSNNGNMYGDTAIEAIRIYKGNGLSNVLNNLDENGPGSPTGSNYHEFTTEMNYTASQIISYMQEGFPSITQTFTPSVIGNDQALNLDICTAAQLMMAADYSQIRGNPRAMPTNPQETQNKLLALLNSILQFSSNFKESGNAHLEHLTSVVQQLYYVVDAFGPHGGIPVSTSEFPATNNNRVFTAILLVMEYLMPMMSSSSDTLPPTDNWQDLTSAWNTLQGTDKPTPPIEHLSPAQQNAPSNFLLQFVLSYNFKALDSNEGNTFHTFFDPIEPLLQNPNWLVDMAGGLFGNQSSYWDQISLMTPKTDPWTLLGSLFSAYPNNEPTSL